MAAQTGRESRIARQAELSAALLLILLGSGPLLAQSYGRTVPEPVAAYMNGVFPTKAPGSAGAWGLENAFPNLTFTDPLQLVELPGDGKFMMAGKSGELWVFDDDPATLTKTTVLDISAQVFVAGDSGVLGLTLHPDFSTPASPNNGVFFLYYRYTPDQSHAGNEAYLRLSRFVINATRDLVDPLSEYVLIQQYDRNDWHNGGGLFFDNEGYLYLSIGDEGGANDAYGVTQKIDERLFAGLLRIDVDQDPTRSHPIRRQPVNVPAPPGGWPASFTQGYYIPNDNPWLDIGGGLLEEFYAIGLRSPHRVTFDPVTEEIWVGDVGQGAREEVSVIFKGANLQWPFMEGNANGPHAPPGTIIGTEQPPIYDYPRSTGNCIIGGFVYRGTKWASSMDGKYLFGDHGVRNIWALTPGVGPPQVDFMVNVPPEGVGGKAGISSFATDADGEIYILKLYGTDLDGGKIYKLVQTGAAPEPATWLSQLGVFTDLTTLAPASWLVPYDVNTALWSDRAAKGRWVAVPNDGAHDTDEEKILVRSYGDWEFPPGTVFIKHFELPVDLANPQLAERLETRVLVIDEDGESYGLTYRWNEAGTDAMLLTTGETNDYTVYDEQGAPTQQTWSFPSRNDCTTCHNANAGWVRGVNTHQLNGLLTYPSTSVTDNQLRTLNQLGMLRPPLRESDIGALPAAIPVDHPSYDRAGRVRSYLDANCAQCHRPNGADAMFDARMMIPLALQNIIDGPLVGDYGPGTAVIKPQDEAASIMLQRASSTGVDRMPPLATSIVHTEGVGAMSEWILELQNGDPLCDRMELALPQSELSIVYADSEETGTPATNAIDGDPDTFWHTEWQASDPVHPHEIQLDLGASYDLSGLTHLPRQNSSPNGAVAAFDVYVSSDGVSWGSPVGSGLFGADKPESRVSFSASGRYVRFVANSEVNGNPWTSMAELNVLKAPCMTSCAVPGSIGDLTLDETLSGTDLVWTTGGTGVSYDVLRSNDPTDFAVPDCIESRQTDGAAHDADTPSVKEIFFYLVRGVNDCSGATAAAGTDSSGTPRAPGLCPGPPTP